MNTTYRRFTTAASSVIAAVSTLAYYLTITSNNNSASACQENKKRPKLVFMGTGSSTGCPKPLCTMLFYHDGKDHPSPAQLEFRDICTVSNLAIQGDPRHNKDYRNNPSLLISHYEQGTTAKNIIIDVGKTFREGALRWFPLHDIYSLDAVILTHHHMDAVAGLDDLRGFQPFHGLDRTEPPSRIPIHVFMSQECLEQVSSQFPWLFPSPNPAKVKEGDALIVKRDVAALKVNVINNYQPFDAAGLEIVPLPVWHGSDLISLGFSFSLHGTSGDIHVVYISDISQMIPETLEYIQTKLPPTDLLIVDCLLPEFQNPVHFSLKQAVELSKELKAKQTYLVGMSCDAFPPHDEMNDKLAKDYGTIQFAHDGQVLYL